MKSQLTDDVFGTDAFLWLNERKRERDIDILSCVSLQVTLGNFSPWSRQMWISSRIWFNLLNSIKNLFAFYLLKVILGRAKLLYTISGVLKKQRGDRFKGADVFVDLNEGK